MKLCLSKTLYVRVYVRSVIGSIIFILVMYFVTRKHFDENTIFHATCRWIVRAMLKRWKSQMSIAFIICQFKSYDSCSLEGESILPVFPIQRQIDCGREIIIYASGYILLNHIKYSTFQYSVTTFSKFVIFFSVGCALSKCTNAFRTQSHDFPHKSWTLRVKRVQFPRTRLCNQKIHPVFQIDHIAQWKPTKLETRHWNFLT